ELNRYVGSSGEHAAPWPHLAQACRVERRRETVRGGRVVEREVEVSYAVTSAAPRRAKAARLLRALRGHWGIENRIHWVRDVTFDEDRCQVRAGAAPPARPARRHLAAILGAGGGAHPVDPALAPPVRPRGPPPPRRRRPPGPAPRA